MLKSKVGRIETGEMKASHLVKNQIKLTSNKAMSKTKRKRDKSDFSTIQNVFDRKTLSNMSKLEVNGFYSKLGMCISTGKEANVYESESVDGTRKLAVKIYKTMVTNFKDRTDYIQGDFRFKRISRQVRTNPHKITAIWAEKEFRNLRRMKEAGIACPEAIKVKGNVLVMSMLGVGDKAFPRLRDVKLEMAEVSNVYLECLFLMRKMFTKVDSVHGDFSEFNLLYDQAEQQLYVIDVSQSVHSHHPLAFEFLKRDIYNVNFYFNKLGIPIFPLGEIFKFIVDKEMTAGKKKVFIEQMIENALDDIEMDPEKKEFEVFLGVSIPTNLFDMDLDQIEEELRTGDYKKNFYSKMIGLGEAEAIPETVDAAVDEGPETAGEVPEEGPKSEEEAMEKNSLEELKGEIVEPESGDAEEEKEEKSDDLEIKAEEEHLEDEGESRSKKVKKLNEKIEELVLMDERNKFGIVEPEIKREKKIVGDAMYGHLSKKERKKLVKEQKREKRKTKMPKKLKKKLTSKKLKGKK